MHLIGPLKNVNKAVRPITADLQCFDAVTSGSFYFNRYCNQIIDHDGNSLNEAKALKIFEMHSFVHAGLKV